MTRVGSASRLFQIGVLSILGLAWLGTEAAYAQSDPVIHPYDGADDWAQLPDGRTWGAPAGVYVDTDQASLWVFERCGANSCAESDLPALMKFDSSGRLLQSFGEGLFVFPHGLHVDRDGYVYVADGNGQDGRGHQVFKFSPTGELLLTLGQAGTTGEGPYTFNRPADVAVSADGDIFVADGHSPLETNMRIVRFSSDGQYIMEWGGKGSAPGQLDDPHSIAFDSQGRLFVADRGNQRIQIFDQEGGYIDAWTQFGSPSGIYISPDDVLYVADLGAGIRIGSAKDGTVTDFIQAPGFGSGPVRVAESVTVDSRGNIYAGENAGMKLMRFTIPR